MAGSDRERSTSETNTIVSLLRELISRPSVTPADEGCQEILARRLSRAGFRCEHLPFGEVSNLWARLGDKPPLLCFAGHTDVVPVGEKSGWSHDPFQATIVDGRIFGRGAADMKGGLAAMLVAVEQFLESGQEFRGSIAFLITSDEEGPAINGTRKVLEVLLERGEPIDWCVIGEPSSSVIPGDVIRIGRRGSLNGKLVVNGVQGHVAYPELADNPIERLVGVANELLQETWDNGSEHFPPTGFQAVSMTSETGAVNVIPSNATMKFNFRYSPEWTFRQLQIAVREIVEKHASNFDLEWQLSGEPFLTEQGDLTRAAISAIVEISGKAPCLSTGGGTSDGRFISPTGAEVVELGPVNETAHKSNENVGVADLDTLCQLYRRIIENLLLN